MDRLFGPSTSLTNSSNVDTYIPTPRLRITVTNAPASSATGNELTTLSSSSSSSATVPSSSSSNIRPSLPSLYTSPQLFDYRKLLQAWVRAHPLQALPALHAKELAHNKRNISSKVYENDDMFNDDEMAVDDELMEDNGTAFPPHPIPPSVSSTGPVTQPPATGKSRLWGVVNKFATHAMAHPLLGILNDGPLDEENDSFGGQSTTNNEEDDDDDDEDGMDDNGTSGGNGEEDDDDDDDDNDDDIDDDDDEGMDDGTDNNKHPSRSATTMTGGGGGGGGGHRGKKKSSNNNIYEYDLNDNFVDDTDLYRARQQARRAGKKLKIRDFLLTTTSSLLQRSAILEARKQKIPYEEALDLVGYDSTEEENDNEELISTTSSILTPYELSSESDTHENTMNRRSRQYPDRNPRYGRGEEGITRRSRHHPQQTLSSRRHRRNKDSSASSSEEIEEDSETDRRHAKRRNKGGKDTTTTTEKPSSTDDATKKLLEFFLRKQLAATAPSSESGTTGTTGGTTEDTGPSKETDGHGLVTELLQLITNSSSASTGLTTNASPNLTALQRKAQEEEKERLRKEKEKEASLRQEEKDVSSRERRQEFLEAHRDKPLLLLAAEQQLMDKYVKNVKNHNQQLITEYRHKKETTGYKGPPPEITFPAEYELELAQLDRSIRRRFKNQRPGPYMVKLMMIPGMPDTLTREKVLSVLKNANTRYDAYETEQLLTYYLQNVQLHVKRRLEEVPTMSMTSFTTAQAMTEQQIIDQDRALALPDPNPMIDTRNNTLLMDTSTLSEEQRLGYEAFLQHQPTNPLDRLNAHGWFSFDARLHLAIGTAFKTFTTWSKYELLYRSLVRGPGRRTQTTSGTADSTEMSHFLQRLIGVFPPENSVTITGLKFIEAHYMLGHYNRYPTNGVMLVTIPAVTVLPAVPSTTQAPSVTPDKTNTVTTTTGASNMVTATAGEGLHPLTPGTTSPFRTTTNGGTEHGNGSSSSSSSSTKARSIQPNDDMENNNNDEGSGMDGDDYGTDGGNDPHLSKVLNDEDIDEEIYDKFIGGKGSKGKIILPRSAAARAFEAVTMDDFDWSKFYPPGGPVWLRTNSTGNNGNNLTTPLTKSVSQSSNSTNRTPLSSHAAQHAAAAASAGLRHPSLGIVSNTPLRMNEIVEIDG